MKYVDEFRNPSLVEHLLTEIKATITRPWTIMEICGGQTHAIIRNGLDQLLPSSIELIHGPGCPVCVTPLEVIDKALAIASLEQVIFTSYGDMLRVPGSRDDLFNVRARGGDVRVVYSPLDAVRIAQENPSKDVVFLAVGFETTAPANAMSILQARALGLKNYSMLAAHVCVPPAMKAILADKENLVQGFLAAGHVNSIMGYWEYAPIAQEYQVPIAVTGFEPLDLLKGIFQVVKMLEERRYEVENVYERVVSYEGNQAAQAVMKKVFEICDRKWRGIGVIPQSGLRICPKYAPYDAEKVYSVEAIQANESVLCIAGNILKGIKKPNQCTAFGKQCTPQTPLGAPMVSAEGACSAYYLYKSEVVDA